MFCPSGVAVGLMVNALREIGEGCLNGDVKKSSGKIQDMKKRQRPCLIVHTII